MPEFLVTVGPAVMFCASIVYAVTLMSVRRVYRDWTQYVLVVAVLVGGVSSVLRQHGTFSAVLRGVPQWSMTVALFTLAVATVRWMATTEIEGRHDRGDC